LFVELVLVFSLHALLVLELARLVTPYHLQSTRLQTGCCVGHLLMTTGTAVPRRWLLLLLLLLGQVLVVFVLLVNAIILFPL